VPAVNKENLMQKMTATTVFLCILQVTILGNTSPVPHDIYRIITEQSDTSMEQHQREAPQLVPAPRFM
jgi:hypothetical protein